MHATRRALSDTARIVRTRQKRMAPMYGMFQTCKFFQFQFQRTMGSPVVLLMF
jgi:hypothetical protein